MRNATCARTETSKLPTKVAILYGSLFYAGKCTNCNFSHVHVKMKNSNIYNSLDIKW
jgi:hypothetical protein